MLTVPFLLFLLDCEKAFAIIFPCPFVACLLLLLACGCVRFDVTLVFVRVRDWRLW